MLGIIVAATSIALILNLILKKIHLPTIIGYILTGTIIAYVFDLHQAVDNHALKEVARSLKDIKEGLDKKIPGDLLALDIRRSLHYLGEITGEITNEDQLDYIFSKFCIGK